MNSHMQSGIYTTQKFTHFFRIYLSPDFSKYLSSLREYSLLARLGSLRVNKYFSVKISIKLLLKVAIQKC